MPKELKILNQFGYELTQEEFTQLKKKHPYIGEKIILDLINGVGVVAKDLNKTSKLKEKIFPRIWDSVSGNSKKRQNQINENIIEGLNATSQWLQDHDRQLSRIDMRMKDVADELYKTQDEILNFYGQFKEVDFRVEMLELFQKDSKQQFDKLESRLTKVEAQQSVDREIEKIYNLNLPLEIEIFTVLDNLASGEVGLYYLLKKDKQKKNDFLIYIKNKIKNRLPPSKKESFIDHLSLHKEIKKLEPIEQKAIAFIGSQYSSYSKENSLYEVSDIIKIVSTLNSTDEVENEINKHSHISSFMTLNSYIDETAEELLTI
jgi:uncharacterized protein YlaN (UPF0358 family)